MIEDKELEYKDPPPFADRPKRARGIEAAHVVCLRLADEYGYSVFKIATTEGAKEGKTYLIFPIHANDDQGEALDFWVAEQLRFGEEVNP